MGDAVPGRTTQEKDLGVTCSADIKVSEQCGIAASKGNQILRLIRRTIMYKMIPELRDLSYESRLLQCGLTTLETRRLRGDQIEVFKIMNGYEDVALVKEQCRLDMRKSTFSQRAINELNKLLNDCINASSVNMFKNRIDRYLIRAGYT